MKIKDIVNRDIVNLTNCDQEPIHIPGSIQPHGFLLGFNDQLIVEYCSGNLEAYTGISYTTALRKHARDIFGKDVYPLFESYLQLKRDSPAAPRIFTLNNKNFNCSLHRNGELWIAEFEPQLEEQPNINAVYEQTVQFVQYMQDADTLQQLGDRVVQEVRKLTGYDRVMLYKFDKDYNGEVYAEAKKDELEPFLGLHYPHTDIPVQARQLYIKNLLRLIVDVNYTPIPVYTIDEGKEKNLDMSFSVLRSVSPIHIQYLQNMGVGATLTISLLHQGKLWGLIACHHYGPKFIDHYTRVNAQLQGHFLTSQIDIRQTAEEYEIAREATNALEKMLNNVYEPVRNSMAQIVADQALLTLCNAAGVAIVLDNVVYKNGITPGEAEILKIAAWAGPYSRDRLFSTSSLPAVFKESELFCETTSGIIFYSLGSTKDACIIWFNPETRQVVNWAGDPEKSIEKNENGLSPRKSFELWKQVVKCQAREWLDPELSAAANYAYALQKHLTYILLHEEENRQRQLSDQLKETNAELENINWISTHDLKEPLRKIQIFSSKLLSAEKELDKDAGVAFHKINESARRMQKLIEGLSVYAKTRHSTDHFETTDLQEKVDEIIRELKEEQTEKELIITASGLPKIKAVPLLVQQLFVNLINNAIKFARKETASVVEINAATQPVNYPGREDEGPFYKVWVKDNGIGFNPEMKEAIFKIFMRLNPLKLYEGSGIGLALCKKIMQIHNGYIEADSEPGNGALFTLYFPAT